MKYLAPFSILILLVMSILSYVKINTTTHKLEEYEKLIINLQNDSENYLSSLNSHSFGHSDLRILLMTGDTISLSTIKNPNLFYFFSPNDCNTCVEENIFAIIELAKNYYSKDKYIITTKDKMQYLSLLSRAHKINSLYFGYVLGESVIPVSHYFMVFNGGISNSYYPRMGHFESTQRYLQNALKI